MDNPRPARLAARRVMLSIGQNQAYDLQVLTAEIGGTEAETLRYALRLGLAHLLVLTRPDNRFHAEPEKILDDEAQAIRLALTVDAPRGPMAGLVAGAGLVAVSPELAEQAPLTRTADDAKLIPVK